ncbi:MAG: hypothetical protein CL612_01780 [Anaerolineaceae bacterium]|nr:hypothetical protein [Anaerolineaceae bacterium]|tara:strand:- start:9681 stop:11072 length:1392 start_codon:yes stop_codon:yes gene_type:complete
MTNIAPYVEVVGPSSDENNTIVVKAPRLFDGNGNFHEHGASVWIEGSAIKAIYGSESPDPLPGAQVLEFEDACILPGLMDSHVHLMYGTADRMSGPRSYDDVNDIDSDALMLLRTVRNGYRHALRSGVTTMRDAGARNRITFDLKEGISAGLYRGFPTLHACGRSITITGGHFHFCHEEADGEEECRKAVRKLVKEGADFIKIMGSGGGTYVTDNRRPSFDVEELKMIVNETHRHGKSCTVHCIATQSIENALDAGVDCIEHYEFVEMDYKRRLDPRIGERMIEQNVFLSPTIQTGYRGLEKMRKLAEERSLTEAEQEQLTFLEWKQEGQVYITGKLYEMGATKFLMGTDAIGEFGDYGIGLKLMVDGGLSNEAALFAATRNTAEALNIMDKAGTLEVGKDADITVVDGNPMKEIEAVQRVTQVIKSGYPLPMAGLGLFPHNPGAAVVTRRPLPKDPQVIKNP